MKRTIIFTVFISLTMLMSHNCLAQNKKQEKPLSRTLKITGVVYDKETRERIPYVYVDFGDSTYVTDSLGRYRIKLTTTKEYIETSPIRFFKVGEYKEYITRIFYNADHDDDIYLEKKK